MFFVAISAITFSAFSGASNARGSLFFAYRKIVFLVISYR